MQEAQFNIRHLIALLDVRALGSINQAAERAHISQSALTQAISRLETQLAVQLFGRTATGVVETAAGGLFLERIQRGAAWLQSIGRVIMQRDNKARDEQILRAVSATQLRALIAVVQAENYTRAANRLNVTQPTLHRAINDLQSLCGMTLFQRSPQGVIPSWHAKRIARYASLYFAEIRQGIAEIAELQDSAAGVIAIGALPLCRARLVPAAVCQLLEERPRAACRIIDGAYEEQLHALLHGQIDMIVGALRHPAPSPDLIQEFLFSNKLNVITRAGHPLAAKADLSIAELRNLKWVAPRADTPSRELFHDFFNRHQSAPPEDIIECSSLIATRGLLLNSDRAALLAAEQVESEVAAGILSVSPFNLTGTERDIGLTLRKDWQPTATQQRFIEILNSLSDSPLAGNH